MGTDARIPRNSLASKGLKLADKVADKYGGDFKKMTAEEQAAFVDIVKDGVEIGDIRQQFIGNTNMRNLIRDAVDSDSVFTEDQKEKIKRKAPVFIGNKAERRVAFTQAGINDELFKEFDGSSLGIDKDDADSFFQARVSKVGKDQAIKDLTSKAGLRGGFSDFADGLSRDKVLASMGLDEKNQSHKQKIEMIDLAARQSMGKGLDENALIGKAVETVQAGGTYDAAAHELALNEYLKKNFGATTVAEARDNTTLARNLNVADNETDILAAIQAKGQFKGITVGAGTDAEKLDIYKAAIARNVDSLQQTKAVMADQYGRIGKQVATETKNASEDNSLLKKAKEEATRVSKDLEAGIITDITTDKVENQARLDVVNAYSAQIKKGKVKTTNLAGAETEHIISLDAKDQEDLIRKVNMWASTGDVTHLNEARTNYAADTGVTNFINEISGDFYRKAADKEIEIVNRTKSKAKASGGTAVATADQLAEQMRTMSLSHDEKIKKRIEDGKKKITDVHGDADKLINKYS